MDMQGGERRKGEGSGQSVVLAYKQAEVNVLRGLVWYLVASARGCILHLLGMRLG